MPFTFCDQNPTPANNYDDYDFVNIFEQDCRSNIGHQDWFIYKVIVSDMGTLANIPHEAAYFGS